jgi:hypothetical protein
MSIEVIQIAALAATISSIVSLLKPLTWSWFARRFERRKADVGGKITISIVLPNGQKRELVVDTNAEGAAKLDKESIKSLVINLEEATNVGKKSSS